MCVECGATLASEPAAPRIRRVLSPVALGVFATLMVASAAYGLTSNLGGDTGSIADKVAAAPPAATPEQAPPPPPGAPPPPAPRPSSRPRRSRAPGSNAAALDGLSRSAQQACA